MVGHAELAERLGALRGARVTILGVGNVLKGDDGVGPQMCEMLAGKVAAQIIDAGTVPENYLRPLTRARPQFLLVVDAVDFGGAPGAIGVFTVDQINDVAFSTHALSLRLFVDVLRTEADVEVLLLGIQPSCTQLGQPVSAPVQESLQELTETLMAALPPADRVTPHATSF
jgi:hydrogenase 3 maturation protease